MIKHLLTGFMKNHIFANLIVLFILVGGLLAMSSMYRELQPSITDRFIIVSVSYSGTDPQEIEESICLKLENALSGLQGVKRIRTTAYEGSAQARIFPAEGYDIDLLKDEVQADVDSITSFPEGADRPIVRKQKYNPEVCGIVVTGNVPEYQLRETAIRIKEDLLKLPNVSEIDFYGTRDLEIQVEISERKLRKYGLTFDKIKDIIAKNGINISTGTINTKVEEFRIKAVGRKYQAKDYNNIPIITKKDGATVKLGQIAKISDSFDKDQKFSIMSDDGKPSVIMIIHRGESDDSIASSKEVHDYMKQENKKLPPTIRIKTFFDTTTYIDTLLRSFTSNGLIGLLLVVLILWLFLDFKLSLWVALGIPVSLAGAFIVMSFTGMTINFFSLFGLIMVVGIIVDDGIVVGESIYERQVHGDSSVEAAINGTAHVAWPVVAAVLTTIISFIPLLYLTGMMKDFVRPIPIVVISALAFSLIEALIVLPVHLRKLKFASIMSKNRFLGFFSKLRLQVNKGLDFIIYKVYAFLIKKILLWRYAAVCVGIFIIFIILGLVKGGDIKFRFFPDTESDMLKSDVSLPAGTPIAKTKALAIRYYDAWMEVNKEFKTPAGKQPGEGFYAFVGNNSINFFIPLVATEEREIPYMELADAWEKKVGVIPEVSKSTFKGMGGEDRPIDLNLYGDNQKILLEAANKLVEKIKTYNGTFDVQTSYEYGKRIFVMTLKPAAYYHKLNLTEIAGQVRDGFSGREALKIQKGKDEIKVNLSYISEHGQNSVKYFKSMKIKTSDGDEIPLDDLVNVKMESAPDSIRRVDGKVAINVYARVNESVGNSKDILADIENNYLPKLAGMYDISSGRSGRARQTNELFDSMMVAVPLALIAIFFILVLIFKSYLQPLVIMVTIPFGVIGAIIGLTIFGLPISLMGIFGTIALAGVVVNDAIVLIDEVNNRLEGGVPFFDAVCDGSKRRVRAILLTTFTTFFGLMPLAFQQSFTAQMLKPMAVTIAFGILFTTLVTLILVPCFFVILNDLRRGFHYIWFLNLPSREEVEPRTKNISDS